MEEFTKNTGQVLEYLDQKNACCTIVSSARNCFQQLKCYLEKNGLSYSSETAENWITSLSEKYVPETISHYKNALLKLDDIYRFGEVRQQTRFKSDGTLIEQLNETLRLQLEDFLKAISVGRSDETIRHYRTEAPRILVILQNQYNISDMCMVTYDTIVCFYTMDIHQSKFMKSRANTIFVALLDHFHKNGLLPLGHTLIVHYLLSGKGTFWNDVSESAMESIRSVQSAANNLSSLEEYRAAQAEINRIHVKEKYSKACRCSYNKWMDLLYMFLEMNSFVYSSETAEIWFREIRSVIGREFRTVRRALCLIEQHLKTGKTDLSVMFLEKPSAYLRMAGWCRPDADAFLQLKAAEGWKKSTLTMYRSCICRFCAFLDAKGIRSFSQLTVSDIKDFNRQDEHATSAGKNAYNVRIRKFLYYLGETRKLTNPMLFIALPSVSAPMETIVITLTRDEIESVKKAVHEDSQELSLRQKAMLLLGLRMGIRSSDIVNLLLDDIDWDQVTLRFIQEKTDVEVMLPIPTDVANALYRYLMQERPQTDCRNVFVRQRAPYGAVGRYACTEALDAALPERRVPGSGFHVTRKTYATSLLSGGVGIDMVTEALGQTGTGAVHHYLSLDEARMRMCPLSLTGEYLMMRGGF